MHYFQHNLINELVAFKILNQLIQIDFSLLFWGPKKIKQVDEHNETLDDKDDLDDTNFDNLGGRPKTNFLDLSGKQQARRMKPILDYLGKVCEEEHIEFDKLIGLAGRKWYHNNKSNHYDHQKGEIFNQIFEGKNPFANNELSVEESSHIKETLELGREKFKNLRNSLKDYVKLSSPDKIREFQKETGNLI